MRKESSVWQHPIPPSAPDPTLPREWDMAESRHAYHLWLAVPPQSEPRIELKGREMAIWTRREAAPRLFQLPYDVDPARARAILGSDELEVWMPKSTDAGTGEVRREIGIELAPQRQSA